METRPIARDPLNSSFGSHGHFRSLGPEIAGSNTAAGKKDLKGCLKLQVGRWLRQMGDERWELKIAGSNLPFLWFVLQILPVRFHG